MTRVLSALLVSAALAVAGCGSSNSSSTSNDTSGATTATPATTTASAAPAKGKTTGGEVEVKMQNIQFSPSSVTVKAGQTVKWVNEDGVDHNVTAKGNEFSPSPNFGKGGSFTYKATKPGTIKYTCTIHPGMDGTLIVK